MESFDGGSREDVFGFRGGAGCGTDETAGFQGADQNAVTQVASPASDENELVRSHG